MKVTREKTENCQAFLTIEMEPTEVEEALEKAYRRLVGKANIPGFRKGKAPRLVVEQHMGKERLLEDALNHLVPQAYEKAIKEQEIEAVAQPHIEVAQTDPVIFKATVPLSPVIQLGNYHDIQVTPETIPAIEENVSAVMEELRHEQAIWEPVERPIDFGDLATLDIESDIEGEPFINKQGVQYQVLRETPSPAPGFAEQLTGMQKGDEKEFNLKFPADYVRNELAEKDSHFKVKAVEIKEEKLPELNDELAKTISPDFETLDSLREQVSNNLRQRAEEKAKMDFEEKVVDELVNCTQVEFPPIFVKAETDRLLNEQSRRLQMNGVGLDDYLKSINKTEEQLREEMGPVATKRVTRSLILGKVAEEEKTEVNDTEINDEIESMMKSAAEKIDKDELREFLNTPHSRESIKDLLITRKTLQNLVEIAKNQEKTKK